MFSFSTLAYCCRKPTRTDSFFAWLVIAKNDYSVFWIITFKTSHNEMYNELSVRVSSRKQLNNEVWERGQGAESEGFTVYKTTSTLLTQSPSDVDVSTRTVSWERHGPGSYSRVGLTTPSTEAAVVRWWCSHESQLTICQFDGWVWASKNVRKMSLCQL